jgi:hypothetical protein
MAGSEKGRASDRASKSWTSKSRGSTGQATSNGRGGRFTAADAARKASEQLEELTQTPVERVTGVQRNDDDGWIVEVEGLELQRVPPTMDVLGSYRVELSDGGDVVGWRRTGRHHRSQVEP